MISANPPVMPSRLFAPPCPVARARADAFLQQQLAERVLERLQSLQTPPLRLALLGTVLPGFDLQGTEIVVATIDDATGALVMPDDIDALADLGTLATVNDLPGALAQIRTRLKPGGFFVSTLYGGDSLIELRHALIAAEAQLTGGAAPRLHPTLTAEVGLQLLQRAGFTDAISDREVLRLTYPNLPTLIRDLRAAALTSRLATRAPRPPRDLFTLAESLWRAADPAPNDRLALTLEVVALTGWTGTGQGTTR